MSARDELAALLDWREIPGHPMGPLGGGDYWLRANGPAVLALIEAAQNTLGYLSWAADVEIPKHADSLTAELREATGRDDIEAVFDSPIPELRDALAAALARLTGGHDE